MKIVTGVRFKRPGKIYYFDHGDLQLEKGMHRGLALVLSDIRIHDTSRAGNGTHKPCSTA